MQDRVHPILWSMILPVIATFPVIRPAFSEVSLILQEKFDTQWQVRADYERIFCAAITGIRLRPLSAYDYCVIMRGADFRKQSTAGKCLKENAVGSLLFISATARSWSMIFSDFLTFASLRTKIAENPKQAGIYNWFKKLIYSSKRKWWMRVLWLCNVMPLAFGKSTRSSYTNREGWLSGSFEQIGGAETEAAFGEKWRHRRDEDVFYRSSFPGTKPFYG